MKKLLSTYKSIEDILTSAGIEKNEAKIEAKMLLKHFLKVSDNDFIFDKEIPDSTIVEEKAFLRASTRMPIQHIIGFAHFMGEDFIVDSSTLIPRDETEILVRTVLEIITQKEGKGKEERESKITQPFNLSTFQPRVLDIGTGSGCIACMIAKLSDAHVLGVDISTDALRIALENATLLNLNNKAIFRKSDLFSNVKKGEVFDMIVSNPPYIPPSVKQKIQNEVKFDPESALYTNDKLGVEFYEKITEKASEFLNPGGYLLFELGINQASLVQKMMETRGFKDIQIIKDLAGIERVILGRI